MYIGGKYLLSIPVKIISHSNDSWHNFNSRMAKNIRPKTPSVNYT